MIAAYYRRLTGDDDTVRNRCALAWSRWEMATSRLEVDPKYLARAENPEWAVQFACIESHYFHNAGFLPEDGHILANINKIRHIPTTIVQGRYDVVCPMKTAWDLHRAFPEANFIVSGRSGHTAAETETIQSLVQACDEWRDQLKREYAAAGTVGSAGLPSDKIPGGSLGMRFHGAHDLPEPGTRRARPDSSFDAHSSRLAGAATREHPTHRFERPPSNPHRAHQTTDTLGQSSGADSQSRTGTASRRQYPSRRPTSITFG